MVGGDKTEDNMEDLQGLVSFSPVVTGGALSDSRGDLLVCLAECCGDRLFLSLCLALLFHLHLYRLSSKMQDICSLFFIDATVTF